MPTPDLDRARAALAAGDAVAAEAALRGAPPSALALALRAGVEAMRAEPAAEASARAALAIDPGCGLAHRHLAVALIQRGDPAAALPHAERGATLEPDDPGAHDVVAVAAAGAARFGAAWDAFVRVAALRPDDATPWRNAGQVALAVDEHAAAAHAFTQALARAPTLAPALEGQARALAALGRDADAAAAWARLAALDPSRADARHLATALAGGHADAPPPGYARAVFDANAARFDELLVDRLQYCGPALVRAALADRGPFPRALDLGCGTGLVGAALRDRCAQLTGVDVAPAMLAQAARRGCYDALVAAELIDFLAAGADRFELVVAADVFIYVGDLAPVFAALAPRLAPGAAGAFTTEVGAGLTLARTGRWSHGGDHVAARAAAHGLAVASRTAATLRREPSGPVAGEVWVLIAPA